MIWIPAAGAFLEAAGVILEKKILRKHKVDFRNYTVFSFLAIVLIMLPFLYFFWSISPEALKLKNILIFLFVIISSTLANLLIFYSLKRKNVTEIEPIRLLQPLFTVLLAVLIYSSERKFITVVLALIATASLVFSNIKKHHLVVNKYIIAAVLGSLLFALELVASKAILSYYSSLTFYFIRCAAILLITLFIFFPKKGVLDKKSKILILITGAIWVVYRLILYYGYNTLGVVFTTILFILSPVLIFLFARIFLKEKITSRQIISTIIIVICVALAIIFGA